MNPLDLLSVNFIRVAPLSFDMGIIAHHFLIDKRNIEKMINSLLIITMKNCKINISVLQYSQDGRKNRSYFYSPNRVEEA